VAAYAIPYQICSRTLILPGALSQALFPRFAAEDGPQAQERCRQLTVFVGQVFALVAVPVIVLAQPLLTLWLGDLLDPRSVAVGQVLMAGFWANAVAFVPFAYIQARGQPRFTALLHLVELLPYFALLALLGSRWGLPGVAAAFSLRCLADALLLIRRAGAADKATLGRLLTATLPVAAALASGLLLSNWCHLLWAAGLLTGASLVALLWHLPPLVAVRLARPGKP
jgi:O-antigen/teichoic acid export membrane protein